MPTNTTNFTIPYPAVTDSPNGAAEMQTLAVATDTNIKKYMDEHLQRIIARAKGNIVSVNGTTPITSSTTPNFVTLTSHLYKVEIFAQWGYVAGGSGDLNGACQVREGGTTIVDADARPVGSSAYIAIPRGAVAPNVPFSRFQFWRPNAGTHTLTGTVTELSGAATLVNCYVDLAIYDLGIQP